MLLVKPSQVSTASRRRCQRKLPEPARHWRRKPAWVVRVVVRMKAHTGLSVVKIAANFNRLYAHSRHVTVCKSWVAETIRKHRYEIAQLRERFKRRVPPPQARNHTWGLDLTGKGDAEGSVHAIAGLIDHGSRRALALQPVRDRSATGLLKIVIEAAEQFGRPQFLRTDNESIFKSRVFVAGLKALGIRHQFSRPGAPWENGRIERLFGTLKEKLNQLIVPNAAALNDAIAIFKTWYNEIRTHNHLNGLTPDEAWFEIDPYRKAPKSVELFNEWDGLLTGFRIRR